MKPQFNYNDGGRAKAGYKGTTGDCVTRAIAIVTELPYQQVYDMINNFAVSERKKKSNARTGVTKKTTRKILLSLGYEWIPTMHIGQGCNIHLKADELPSGRLLCSVSKHLVAVIDGVINDIYDPSRSGTRCVYGYYKLK